MPGFPDRDRVRLLYILAASHSGSTLLAMLLGSHPEVCTVGELKHTSIGDVNRYRCSCGALIRECEFWNAVGEDVRAHGFDYQVGRGDTDFATGAPPAARRLLKPLHRSRVLELIRDAALACVPGWRRHRDAVQARTAALAAAVCRRSSRSVIVDSSKIGVRLKFLLRNRGFDVRVVRLVRDGRAVALTYMDPALYADSANPARRGGGQGGDRAAERLSLERAAREWRRSNEEAAALLRTVSADRWIEVKYEDLCANPAGTIARIFDFAGVDPARASTDFRAHQQHVVGNGMRLDATSEIRLDARWRTALQDGDLRRFDAVAGDLNRRLGYVQVTA
jgi:hypothetical protein